MTIYGLIFYLIAAVILVATGLAITRRNPVHAVIYLIISFFGSAVLFFLLGAPFVAALEVIIYAGAIMVLFLFVIMMLRVEDAEAGGLTLRQWGPAILLGLIFFSVAALVFIKDPGTKITLEMAMAMPRQFGRFVFQRYWLSIEIISLLLLLGLLAAIQLGRGKGQENGEDG
jgi:NADH-quinone oxidoreductase subunit J